MKRKISAVGMMVVLIVALVSVVPPVENVVAASNTVTVNLLDSNGNGLAGGDVHYYDSGWKLLGTTNSTGTVSGTVPKTTDIEIRYAGGRYKWVKVDPSTTPTLTISTVLVTVKLETCEGTPLIGEAVYYFGGWASIGNTPATIELLPYSGLGSGQGNYDFRVKYEGRTSPIHTQDVAVDLVVVFKTTKVTLFGSEVLYYNNGWQTFTSPKEMIGGTSNRYGTTAWCDFKFGGSRSPTVRLDIDGCSITGVMITLVDEADNPLADYPSDYPAEQRNLQYRYRYGGTWAPWVSIQTDANGQFFVNIDPAHLARWDKKVTVRLNQTSKEQDVTVNPVFRAARVNVNLKTCDGPIADVPGGAVHQGGGYWYKHGDTGPSGTVTFYAFPGSVKVRMTYSCTRQTIDSTPIVAGTNEVDFLATKVTFYYADGIRSNTGGVCGWWMFSKPTMNLLPREYNFWFKKDGKWGDPVKINVSGCEMNMALLRVLDENGNGVAGGIATAAIGGSWQASITGQTDSSGLLLADWNPAWTKIKMTANQGSQEQTIAQLTASGYTWTTEILRIWLLNTAGNPMTDQKAVLWQGGGYWYKWGNLNAYGYRDIQLFPGSYRFRMHYNDTSETKYGIPVTAGAGIENFYFRTGQVFGPCITQYTGVGWSTFVDGMELMPGTYTFTSPSQSGTVTAGEATDLNCP